MMTSNSTHRIDVLHCLGTAVLESRMLFEHLDERLRAALAQQGAIARGRRGIYWLY